MHHFCTPIRTCGQSTGTWQKMLQVLTFCTHRKQNTLLYITVNEFANTCDDSILLTFLHIVFIYISGMVVKIINYIHVCGINLNEFSF